MEVADVDEYTSVIVYGKLKRFSLSATYRLV
jgi:hypothetical protein